MRCVGRVLWVAWGCGAAVADCRVAREAWLATPRSTTRFTSTVFPHGFGCLDWPHAGVSGGRARHPTPPSRPANKNPETKQRQACSPKATDTKARPPNQFNNQTRRKPRKAQRPMQSKPSPPNQPGGATGPTSISLFVLVCIVWVCSPKATDTKPSPPSQPDGATGPTSISLFVLVCAVWVCSPKATETKATPPNQFNNQATQRPR